MADISKCFGKGCSRKATCYRFTAKANPYRQSYAAFDEASSTCEYYWPLEVKKKAFKKAVVVKGYKREFNGHSVADINFVEYGKLKKDRIK